jgi:hypothetical protein
MVIKMNEDTAQGVFWELCHVLNTGWTITQTDTGFVVGLPTSYDGDLPSMQQFTNEVWRIAQFVGYSHMVQISLIDDDQFQIKSTSGSGSSFEISVFNNKTDIVDHRALSQT